MRPRLVMLLPLLAPIAWAHSAPDMAPRHATGRLLANDQVGVFAVTLKSTDFLVVTLQDREVIMWPEGDILGFRLDPGDVRFYFGGWVRAPEKDGLELLIPDTDIDLKVWTERENPQIFRRGRLDSRSWKSTAESAGTHPARLVLVQFGTGAEN